MAWQRPLATVSLAVSCGRAPSVSTVLVLRPFYLHCRQTTLSLQVCKQTDSPSPGLRAALRSRVAVPRAASSSLAAMRKGAMTRRLDLAMLLLLTFSTGMVDAIGYLGFDKVFTGNMTGNVVILGMGLAGADGVPVLRPALALVFFMVGAALSGRILGNIGETWQRRTTLIFASVAVGCAGLSLYVGLMPNPE